MAVRELVGVLLMGVSALLVIGVLLLRTMLNRLHMPYFPFAGAANFLLALVAAGCIVRGHAHKQVAAGRWKWVWMRGVLGCSQLLLQLLALAAGAPLGDVSALGSINVVVAALLGRAFLGERLGCLHILAIGLSIVGACLVAQPAMLLYPQALPGNRERTLGYALALASGTASGFLFLVSRKLRDVSPVMGTFSVAVHDGLGLWLVFLTRLVPEPPPHSVCAKPGMAALSMLLMIGAIFGSVVCLTVGSQTCPAAISSTVFTSCTMAFGYAAQVVIHSQRPEAFTLYGAAMMLLAVTLMAVAAASGKGLTVREGAAEGKSQSPTAVEGASIGTVAAAEVLAV